MTAFERTARIEIALLVLADGLFHLLANFLTLQKFAPDWIIATWLGTTGFGIEIHKFIGVLLIGMSIWTLSGLNRDGQKVYYYLIVPLALGMIMLALLLKIWGLV